MIRAILCILFLLPYLANAQVINITNTSAIGRFNSCAGTTPPVVTATYISGSGSTFSNGSIMCNDPCGSTTIKVTITNLRWYKGPEDQWLHGVFLPANAGFSVSGINLPAGFIAYNGGCIGGCPAGILTGPGFYYDATAANSCCAGVTANDGNPCNNWGLTTIACSPTFGFEFNLTFCNSNLTNTTETFTLTGTGDGATGCWSNPNFQGLNAVTFTINTIPCAPINNMPLVATPVNKDCSGATVNYTSTLTGGCGNGSTISWWNAATGGTLVGTGSPFVYDPAGSTCPAGTTLYASCCVGGTTACIARVAVTIPGTCDPPIDITNIVSTSGDCLILSSISSVSTSNNFGGVTYTLNPGNSSNTTGIFTGLNLSSYTVTVSDGSNCTKSSIVNFIPITLPTIGISTTGIDCNGGLGSITALGSGTTIPYSYSLNSNPLQASGFYGGLSAGSYTVSVTDGLGCSASSIVTLIQPNPIIVNAVQGNIPCFGGTTTITASASGGNGVYQYNLNGGAYQSGGVFTNNIAGTYTINVLDGNNCTGSTIFTVIQPSLLTASVSTSSILCSGGTFTVTINANGGTLPSYQYSLNGAGFQTLNVYSNISAGTYTVQVYDGNNCTYSTVFTVAAPNPITVSASTTSIICNGGTSTLTATASGGTGPYQYSLNGSAYSVTTIFSGLVAGSYTVTAKDINNCTKSTIVIITQPPLLTILPSATSINCNGATGTIIASASGGVNSYQYNINGGTYQIGNAFGGLFAGSYTITVIDGNGCTASTIFNLVQPPLLTLGGSFIPILCNGDLTTITLNALGGTTPSYQYNLNGGTYQSSTVFSTISAGNYTATVMDANNCTATTLISISQPFAMVVDLMASTISCFGGTAVITTNIVGGAPNFQYSINGGAYQANNQFNNNLAGTYTITVKDANNCTATSTILITQPTALTVSASSSSIACNGATSTITVTASGGTIPIYQYSLNGSINQLSNSFSNNSFGTYTVVVTDGNSCTASTTLNIIQPQPLTITLSATNIACFGGTSTISATANGGTIAYLYNINGGANQLSNSFNGIIPGTYTVQVTDANNCTATSTILITQPNPLSVSASATVILCYGNLSTITAGALGGTTAYSYNVNGGAYQVSPLFNNQAAGNYTITVKDANNCTATTVLSITEPTQVTLSLAATTILCNGGTSTITATANGGTIPAYQYNLNAGAWQASTIFLNNAAGSYTVAVMDANGCTVSSIVTIAQPNPLIVNITTSTIPTCVPGNDASLTVAASGGVVNYQYSINGSAYQASNIFTGLGVSTYTITVLDANNCTASTVQQINNPNSPTISNVAITNVTCFAYSNGQILVTANGQSTLSYNLQAINQTNASGNFPNLLANTYTIIVTDVSLCSASSVVIVTQPTALTIINFVVNNTLCATSTDGSINTTVSGGTGLINYNLQPGNQNNSTGIFASLSSGSYTIIASDANGCTISSITTISNPLPIVLVSININDETCNNSQDGQISISCSGGTGIITYVLTPSAQTNTTGLFTALSANTYTITVTDVNNCSYSTTAIIQNPLPISFVSVSHTDVLCVGNTNGTISALATGGNAGAYTYTLQPGGTSNTTGIFTNLSVNTYTITATDVNGCSISAVEVIITPSPLIFTLDSSNNVTCNGVNNGSFYTTASGGSGTYSYFVLPGSIIDSVGDYTQLAASNYTIVVTDGNGCTLSISPISITQPSPINLNIVSQQNITCYDGTDGACTIQVSGGTANSVLSIQPLIGNFNPPGNFFNLTANSYTITATDANGCTQSIICTITQYPQVIFDSIILTPPTCYGDLNGTIAAYASGGTPSLTYQLNNFSSTSQAYYNNLIQGTYTLTVFDAKGCTIDSVVQLVQPNPLSLSSLEVTPVDCDENKNGKIIATAQGGSPEYTYILRPQIKINHTGIFTKLLAATYTLTIRDSSGCEIDTLITILPPSKYMEIDIQKKDLGCYGKGFEGEATANILNGTPPYTYSWSTTPPQFTQTANGLNFGYYFLQVVDARGCIRYDTVYIRPGPCCDELFIPNAFSPNGDGMNDVFRMTTSTGIEIIQFSVFNRWGIEVWSTIDVNHGWDGIYQGTLQDMNTYYYVLKYRCVFDGNIYLKKGDVILMH